MDQLDLIISIHMHIQVPFNTHMHHTTWHMHTYAHVKDANSVAATNYGTLSWADRAMLPEAWLGSYWQEDSPCKLSPVEIPQLVCAT